MYTNKYFEFYDYNEPLNLSELYKTDKFDLIIADPPYISEECITKTCVTIKYLSAYEDNDERKANDKMTTKLIICTGQLVSELLQKYLNIHICLFEPKHERSLANQFKCYANYSTFYLDSI